MTVKTFRTAIATIILVASGLTVGINTPRSAEDPAPATANVGVQDAERLVIQFRDGQFTLLSRTPVRKVLPPSTMLPAKSGDVRGTWFEVQDKANATVYRRPMTSPRILVSESLNDSTGQIERAESVVDDNVFSVLVPAGDNAKSLVIFDSPTDPNKRTVAASEVGRLILR